MKSEKLMRVFILMAKVGGVGLYMNSVGATCGHLCNCDNQYTGARGRSPVGVCMQS